MYFLFIVCMKEFLHMDDSFKAVVLPVALLYNCGISC